MRNETRQRIWLYSIFVACVAVLLLVGVVIPWIRLHRGVQQTVDILRPQFAADKRFTNIRVVRVSSGVAVVSGVVRSDSDLAALKRLVEDSHLPRRPAISVHVSPAAQ